MWAQTQAALAMDWIGLVLKGGELGLLAYLVLRTGPQILADQRGERERISTDFAQSLDRMQIAFEKRNKALTAALEKQTADLLKSLESLAVEVRGLRGH